MSISNQADFYLNFQQFGDMKLGARSGSDDAAKSVAGQFEGLFVQQMLAAMRSAAKIDSGQDSSYLNFYQEMYDKQLAQTVAGQNRLGVAKLILQQMPTGEPESGNPGTGSELDFSPVRVATLTPDRSSVNTAAVQPGVATSANEKPTGMLPAMAEEIPAVRVSRVLDDDFAEVSRIEQANKRWQSPDQFIADILPQAQAAADTLGISARLLVAQSALETGWGKHTMKYADGRSSNNLFGIKTGTDWQGPSLQKTSLEFRDGVLQNQVSRFRAYDTPAQSFADYVKFIHGNPRYQQALAQAGDDQAFIREIHRAGYATDPRYADKVLNILNSGILQRALAGLDAGVSDHA
ncbi:MAG: flagellar assembly peptidoglycan hydrolase FlgJ [Gammaproteobacteria bacterium]|nr:flagellar assembly peptidoglycan hydrolase FlgJ [Gammaproteobacteria bacterium]